MAVGADAHVATVVQVWTAVCVLRCDVAVATQFLTRHSGSGGSTAVNSDFWTNATYVNNSLFINVTSVNSDFFINTISIPSALFIKATYVNKSLFIK